MSYAHIPSPLEFKAILNKQTKKEKLIKELSTIVDDEWLLAALASLRRERDEHINC